jgi:hypothetical protein
MMTLKLGESSQKAVDELLSQGFVIAKQQDDYPLMPRDLTELDSEQLSYLFSRLTAWSNYVATQLSAAQIDERTAEKTLDMTSAKLMVSREITKNDKVAALKAAIASDPTIMKLSDNLDNIYAYRKMVEVMFHNLERDTALVSREITRRSSDFRAIRKDKSSW